MRLLLAAALAVAVFAVPARAQDDLPEGVEALLTCATVYSMRSDEAREAGDEGAATEFFHMGDAVRWQAVATLEGAGYSAEAIEDVEMNFALMTGFNYGAGMGEQLLADCLAAWDSP